MRLKHLGKIKIKNENENEINKIIFKKSWTENLKSERFRILLSIFWREVNRFFGG